MEPIPDQQTTTTNHDLFKGCIFGALCGDAIGAYLEFKAIITPKDVEKALTLPGGGAHKVGKGQITDDSELLLCLGHGLSEGKGVLDLDKIAAWYGNWVKSRPFDMGATTRNALPKAVDMKSHQARLVRLGASKSQTSQSNGALMRITPMCLWAHKLNRDDLIRAVSEETKLTHPNQTAIDVSVAYVYTIQYLFNHKGDHQGTYKACKEIAEHLKNPELLSWIEEVERGELTIVHKASGWVKHAFCYALHYLRNNTGYEEALKDVMGRKGDTDTNACIIGGMLGALHGVSGVPAKAIERVLKFDPTKESGIKRPEFLVPGKCVNRIIEDILKCAPTTLEMVGAESEEEKARL